MKKSKYKIIIWFQPDQKGQQYELEKITLRTKLITMNRAKELAVQEAEKCWKHYDIELEPI